ncbi:hypothetical protein PL75_04735 [Neisseria arctica]|uniref:Uncharacterized protein n=1 Tax=Neisseria arctica TaxID=1470200 RepID=A0A0J0YSX4_9NEIS|nr:hypothetical protein [Neisseria arctica]KLT73206.1 hypothetical protein PL75_04735 [Neisseria arctica]UOO87058.1 hypothetical protein LVJ86_02050 [Neisseria arctica]
MAAMTSTVNLIAPVYMHKETFSPADGNCEETCYTASVLPPCHLRPDTDWLQKEWKPFNAPTQEEAEAAAMAYCRVQGWQYQRVSGKQPIYPQIHHTAD